MVGFALWISGCRLEAMYSLTSPGLTCCAEQQSHRQQPEERGVYRKAALICRSSPQEVHLKETVALNGPCLH